jgi:hypothetical protein
MAAHSCTKSLRTGSVCVCVCACVNYLKLSAAAAIHSGSAIILRSTLRMFSLIAGKLTLPYPTANISQRIAMTTNSVNTSNVHVNELLCSHYSHVRCVYSVHVRLAYRYVPPATR